MIRDSSRVDELQQWIETNAVDCSQLFLGSWRQPVRPLHVAIEAQNEGAVRLLLQHGADPNAVNLTTKTTPLYAALVGGFIEDSDVIISRQYIEDNAGIIRLLRQYGANKVVQYSSEDKKEFDEQYVHLASLFSNLLRFAVNIDRPRAANLLALIAPLHGYGPIININSPCNESGDLPLHLLAKNASAEFWNYYFPILCQAEIPLDLTAQDSQGLTALHRAAENKTHGVYIITKLAEAAKRSETVNYRDYLFGTMSRIKPIDAALNANNVAAFRHLLTLMLDEFDAARVLQPEIPDNFAFLVKFPNAENKTIFDLALEHSNPAFLQELIQRGLIGDFGEGQNIIHRIITLRYGKKDFLQWLQLAGGALKRLDSATDLSSFYQAKDAQGRTPLALLLEHYWSETVSIKLTEKELIPLLSDMQHNGADLKEPDIEGKTPLYRAIEKKQFKLAAWLLENTQPIEFCLDLQPPLLHLAAQNNWLKIFEYLQQRALVNQDLVPAFKSALNYEFSPIGSDSKAKTPLDLITRWEKGLPVFEDNYLILLKAGGDHAGSKKAFHYFMDWILQHPEITEFSSLKRHVMAALLQQNPEAFLTCDEQKRSPLSRVIEIQHHPIMGMFLQHSPDELTPFYTLRLLMDKSDPLNSQDRYRHTLAPALALCNPSFTTKLLITSALAVLFGLALLAFGAVVLLSGGLGITILPFIIPAMTTLNLVLGLVTSIIGTGLIAGGVTGLIFQVPKYRVYCQAEKMIAEFNANTETLPEPSSEQVSLGQ